MSNAFNNYIVNLVNSNWVDHNKITYLTQLGQELIKLYDVKKETSGMNLSGYVKYALGKQIRLEQHPYDDLTWGVVPIDAKIPNDKVGKSKLFRHVDEDGKHQKFIIYDRVVWASFSIPIKLNSRRYINVTNGIIFEDLPNDSIPPEGSYEIEDKFVTPDFAISTELRGNKIRNDIKEWLALHPDIDPKLLIHKADSTRKSDTTLLENIFDRLSDNDLRKISVPLDIVKLLNK